MPDLNMCFRSSELHPSVKRGFFLNALGGNDLRYLPPRSRGLGVKNNILTLAPDAKDDKKVSF